MAHVMLGHPPEDRKIDVNPMRYTDFAIDEMIKDMENREERKKIEGMHYMDISFIREELGLRSEEA